MMVGVNAVDDRRLTDRRLPVCGGSVLKIVDGVASQPACVRVPRALNLMTTLAYLRWRGRLHVLRGTVLPSQWSSYEAQLLAY